MIYFDAAGLICFCWQRKKMSYSFHLFVRPKYWTWGYDDTDLAHFGMEYYGFGPLFLFVVA